MADVLQAIASTAGLIAVCCGLCEVAQIGVLAYYRGTPEFDREREMTIGGLVIIGFLVLVWRIFDSVGGALE